MAKFKLIYAVDLDMEDETQVLELANAFAEQVEEHHIFLDEALIVVSAERFDLSANHEDVELAHRLDEHIKAHREASGPHTG